MKDVESTICVRGIVEQIIQLPLATCMDITRNFVLEVSAESIHENRRMEGSEMRGWIILGNCSVVCAILILI